MRFRSLAASLVLSVAAAAPAAAQVTTIDFAEFRRPEYTLYQATPGGDVTSKGYSFLAAYGTGAQNTLGTWGTVEDAEKLPSNLGPTAAALWAYQSGERIDLVNEAGFGFDLLSIDVAHMYPRSYLLSGDLAPITLFFYGFDQNGLNTAALVQSFTITPPALVGGEQTPFLQTLAFNQNFRNLSGVAWFQQSGPFNAGSTGSAFSHQFTNVVVNTVTPEPSTYVLLGAGLAGVLGMARRRRRAA